MTEIHDAHRTRRLRSRPGAVVGWSVRWMLVVVAVALALGSLRGLLAQGTSTELQAFSFSLLNRTYEDLVEELAPVQVGPATVLLRSPSHRLQLHEHSVQLARGTAPGLGAALVLEISGQGTIEADVQMGAVRSRLDDELTLPRQSVSLLGRVSIASSDEGYLIKPLELPESVSVRIESRLARQLFVLCRPMALVLVNMDCRALEESLSTVQVPLPEIGSAYVLPYDELTAEERLRFERFLDG